jgi:hypothetical protein
VSGWSKRASRKARRPGARPGCSSTHPIGTNAVLRSILIGTLACSITSVRCQPRAHFKTSWGYHSPRECLLDSFLRDLSAHTHTHTHTHTKADRGHAMLLAEGRCLVGVQTVARPTRNPK